MVVKKLDTPLTSLANQSMGNPDAWYPEDLHFDYQQHDDLVFFTGQKLKNSAEKK